MASAFDGLCQFDYDLIRRSLLAGDTMAEVRSLFTGENGKPRFTVRRMREMRDEIFEPLIADPEKVKALANGPVLNANKIVRYRRNPGPRTRMARAGAVQTEMFPA
jgi:hypothetical protein